MLGKYTVQDIHELLSLVKGGSLGDSRKEFWQARAVLVKQDASIYGDHKRMAALIEGLFNLKGKINLDTPFRLYIFSAQERVEVKDVSFRDSLEFSFMTYQGFSPAHELRGEKIAVVEALLQKHRLPVDLWSKPGFQLLRWETQVFDVSATGEVEEVV